MTGYQNFMLSICFGVAAGIVLLGWWFTVKDLYQKIKVRNHKRKNKDRKAE